MKKKVDWKNIDEAIRAFLGTKQHLVGVEILKKETTGNDIHKLDKPMAFCKVVKEASKGEAYIYAKPEEGCPTGEIVLGFRAPKYSELEPRVKPAETKYVYVAALNIFQGDPAVILSIINPKQMMDLTQALQTSTNEPIKASFKGEAACSDFFASPYVEGKPNISFLCHGARLLGDFKDSELIFGAPPDIYIKLAEITENLCKTGGALCGCRTSDIPADITYSFDQIGFSKSTDYFFGRVKNRNVRIYLNKDLQGRLKLVTIHVPLKMSSKEEATNLSGELRRITASPYRVSQRENWIDVSMTAGVDELNIDLQTGENLEHIINGVVERIEKNLKKTGYKEAS